jgi:hypothetical protein
MGTVYLLHFSRKLALQAGHYIGYADNLSGRLAHHANGTGAKITAALRKAGGSFRCARVWPGGDRTFERKLKNQKNAAALCPICRNRNKKLKPSKMKHWTRHLDNTGRAVKVLAEKQENRQLRIDELREKIRRELAEYRQEDRELEAYVMATDKDGHGWDENQVAEAKAAAAKENGRSPIVYATFSSK